RRSRADRRRARRRRPGSGGHPAADPEGTRMTTVALLTSHQPAEVLRLGTQWAEAGDDVTVVLLDAAAAVLRPRHPDNPLVAAAQDAGVTVWVHDAAVGDGSAARDARVKTVD